MLPRRDEIAGVNKCTYLVVDRGKECDEQAFKHVFVAPVDGHRGDYRVLVKTRSEEEGFMRSNEDLELHRWDR